MKTNYQLRRVFLTAPVLLFFLASSVGFGYMGLEMVTKQVAREMGVAVRTSPVGVDAVRFELEFEAKGALKEFERVDLEISHGGSILAFSSLREERSKDGHIVVSFIADRARMDDYAVRVITGNGMFRAGYQVQLRDFVAAEKTH